MTNLYTNPQEDLNIITIYHPVLSVLQNEFLRYQIIFKKYPPNNKMGYDMPK